MNSVVVLEHRHKLEVGVLPEGEFVAYCRKLNALVPMLDAATIAIGEALQEVKRRHPADIAYSAFMKANFHHIATTKKAQEYILAASLNAGTPLADQSKTVQFELNPLKGWARQYIQNTLASKPVQITKQVARAIASEAKRILPEPPRVREPGTSRATEWRNAQAARPPAGGLPGIQPPKPVAPPIRTPEQEALYQRVVNELLYGKAPDNRDQSGDGISEKDALAFFGISPLTKETLGIIARHYASKHHPDKGGSHDMMAQVNKMRARLERVAS